MYIYFFFHLLSPSIYWASVNAAKEKGASCWLTAMPLKRLGFILNKQEFRDAIALRYNWSILDIPKYCGCGNKNDIYIWFIYSLVKKEVMCQ